jgi:hypothetical protein
LSLGKRGRCHYICQQVARFLLLVTLPFRSKRKWVRYMEVDRLWPWKGYVIFEYSNALSSNFLRLYIVDTTSPSRNILCYIARSSWMRLLFISLPRRGSTDSANSDEQVVGRRSPKRKRSTTAATRPLWRQPSARARAHLRTRRARCMAHAVDQIGASTPSSIFFSPSESRNTKAIDVASSHLQALNGNRWEFNNAAPPMDLHRPR